MFIHGHPLLNLNFLLGVFHLLYLPQSSPWHIFLWGIVGRLGLIYVSRCVVSPIGNVCVMASLRALSKQMRIRRSRRPVRALCRQAPAGSPDPPFNPCRCVASIESPYYFSMTVCFLLWWVMSIKWANDVARDESMDVAHEICTWGAMGHVLCMSAMFATAPMND